MHELAISLLKHTNNMRLFWKTLNLKWTCEFALASTRNDFRLVRLYIRDRSMASIKADGVWNPLWSCHFDLLFTEKWQLYTKLYVN